MVNSLGPAAAIILYYKLKKGLAVFAVQAEKKSVNPN